MVLEVQEYDIVKCPLNYVGGKTKILPQILPLFPKNINTFVDVSGGGFNVGANVKAKKYIYNDVNENVVNLIQLMHDKDAKNIIRLVNNRIKKYKLSKNKSKSYYKYRNIYNENPTPIDLFTLICYSFSNNIRFNSNNEFNVASGKGRSYFNSLIKSNLTDFCNRIKNFNVSFKSYHFEKLLNKVGTNSFIYLDPPYLISEANYNSYWDINEEKLLLGCLDNLNEKGIKFALSNVIQNKGFTNRVLKKWAKKYNVFEIEQDYNNCSSNRLKRRSKTLEVLICNYEPDVTLFNKRVIL